jgi:adiponectin receptor
MTVAVSLLSFFQATRFRVFRASLFAALGLWGIAPACHILYLYWNKPAMVNSFAHAMVMGVIYVVRLP